MSAAAVSAGPECCDSAGAKPAEFRFDPIATAKIEELIHDLRDRYTIVVVTHSMQQAARVSDLTAFLYLGELVEFGDTNTVFTNPKNKQTEDYITGRFG